MAFWKNEQKLIEEALRHKSDMDRALKGSSVQLLGNLRLQEELRIVSEAHKVFESYKTSAVRNAIDGISYAAREAMGKTVASFHALAINSAQQAAIESLRAIQLPKTYLDPFSGIGSITNRAVHLHFASSRAAIESSLVKHTLELAAQAIAEANRVNISKLGALSGSSALAALDFSRFNNDLEQIRAINNSYSGKMAAALRELLNSPEISDKTLRPIQDLVDSKIKSLPQDRISAEGLLTLILTLIGVLLTYGGVHQLDPSRSLDSRTASPRAKSTQVTQIAELVQQLVTQTSRLIPDYDQNSYYLVKREAELRLKPRAKSLPFGSLFPNQKVRIIKRHHKWIYAEYFDEIEGAPRYGWAHKKYFKYIHSTVHQVMRQSEELDKAVRLEITDEWEATNAKRVHLIQKKLKNRISADEKRELEYLQQLADQRIRLVAPLPIEHFNTILDEVTRSN